LVTVSVTIVVVFKMIGFADVATSSVSAGRRDGGTGGSGGIMISLGGGGGGVDV
jgi:hypothetical protein